MFFNKLQQSTEIARQGLFAVPVIIDALYIAFLTQAYHHVKHTVPLLMACGSRLPERYNGLRTSVAHYIEEEIGHEEWILNDIAACGGDAAAVRAGRPALATEAMVAYAYHQIDQVNPLAFFGMVHVLEGASTAIATNAAMIIRDALGLPQSAFTYLTSHGSLDLEHVAFFEKLMNGIDDSDDQAAIIHSANVIYRLYGDIFRSLPRPQATSAEFSA